MTKNEALLVERGLPSNVEAERLVLGSILLDGAIFLSVAESITEDDFSLDKHRLIFGRMAALYESGSAIDRVTVANLLQAARELETVGGLSYLVSLDDGLPQISNLEAYVRILQNKSMLRRMVYASRDIIGQCLSEQGDPGELLERAQRVLVDLSPRDSSDLQTPYGVIEQAGIGALTAGQKGGIASPMRDLNNLIVGFQPGELTLIGARPSVGKTAFALQCSHHAAAKLGAGGIFFSLEMGKLSLAARVACSVANVDSHALRTGALNSEERIRLMAAVESIKDLPLWIDKRSHTLPAIHSTIRRAKASGRDIRWAVIDYLQLMNAVGKAENRNQELSAISRGLKLAAEELGVAMIALSQFSRPERGSNKEPDISDLRDCGSLEQDADLIVLLHAPEGNANGSRRLLVKKQRSGPLGSVESYFIGKYQRFEAITGEREQ